MLRSSLDYGAHPELLAVFPFPHRVSMEVRLAERRLSVQVRVTPTGERAVPISFGFHPYIALPGSERHEWQVQLPVLRRAVLDEHQIPTGREDELEPGALSGPLGHRVFDDSFPALTGSTPEFSVADSRRRVSVQFTSGYPVAQVYAPAGAAFIAFEPMTAPVDALRSGNGLRFAEPGEEFSAEFAIAVDVV
jgi:galactose mutarotase-like enzyme